VVRAIVHRKYQDNGVFVLFIYSALLMHALFAVNAASLDTLYATLDLRTPIQEGWFDPSAESVGLRGDQQPLSWGTTYPASDPDGDGIYQVAIPFELKQDSLALAYKIKVDGISNPEDGWQAGRNHRVTIRRNQHNIIKLAWEEKAPPPKSTVTGHVQVIKNFKSDSLLPRDLYIYLPPGYFDSDLRYPVLYMHDGQNLFDAAIAGQEWGLDEAAESLIQSGDIEPLIIVGIGNTGNRLDEYTPTRQLWHRTLARATPPIADGQFAHFTGSFTTEQGDSIHFTCSSDTLFVKIPGSDSWQRLLVKADTMFYLPRANITFRFHKNNDQSASRITADKPPMGGDGEIYGTFLISTLKPFIDKNFRTRSDAEFTALGGSSLGGLITLHLGLLYPDVFGQLLVLSPSVWWDDRVILKTVQNLSKPTHQDIRLYVGTGESEGTVKNVRELEHVLKAKGWANNRLEYVEVPDAGHNERAWSAQAAAMLRFIFNDD
jgi:predicted alpha/beta superfamily hydrolase